MVRKVEGALHQAYFFFDGLRVLSWGRWRSAVSRGRASERCWMHGFGNAQMSVTIPKSLRTRPRKPAITA